MLKSSRYLLVVVLSLLAACASTGPGKSATKRAESMPSMAWSHKADGVEWTKAALSALEEHGTALADMVPRDISTYCPAYPEASREDREAFWAGIISALAKHESTWREDAVGGGGRWYGLVQIAPGTARSYGCDARSGSALLDGSANISCAIRIMSSTVPRDGVVSAGMRGLAADWGPFHSSSKRAQMAEWSRKQDYCKAG